MTSHRLHPRWLPVLPLTVVVLAASLAACVGSSPGAGSTDVPTTTEPDRPPVAVDPTVAVVDDVFDPDVISVMVGTELTWVWSGERQHDVVSRFYGEGQTFQSERMIEGTFTHLFDEPGSYIYRCQLHPGMTGTVHVVPRG